jgi:hypothetical protein
MRATRAMVVATLVVASSPAGETQPAPRALVLGPEDGERRLHISVPAGEPAPPLSVDELTAIRMRHAQHVVYDPLPSR